MLNIPVIGISIGDINGIGPEIVIKSLSKCDLSTSVPVVFAPEEVLSYYLDKLSLELEYAVITSREELRAGMVNVYSGFELNEKVQPGTLNSTGGLVAMRSVETAIEWCISGAGEAMVTAPISKEAVNLAGYHIPGHTEFLAEKTNTETVVMMLVNKGLRVALTTVHEPIQKVADLITEERILERLQILNDSLINDFSIPEPKIAVLGLNPHAGDGGVLGTEEIGIIEPAIEKATNNNITAHGPFPADGFFGQQLHTQYDAILAMYHDQGLAPFKLLSFGKGVNFTAGLPIIRTSPDHGTAYNIAGKGIANSSSFDQAYDLAVELALKRRQE